MVEKEQPTSDATEQVEQKKPEPTVVKGKRCPKCGGTLYDVADGKCRRCKGNVSVVAEQKPEAK